MIINHRHFDLNGKTLIEKLTIKAPLYQSPVFQNEACFIYLQEGQSIVNSPTEKVQIAEGESVLLKCGSYFAEIVNKVENALCEVFVIHLYPDILKEIYENEIPDFIKTKNHTHYSRKIIHTKVIQQFIQSLDFYFENQEIVSTELLRLKLKELVLLLLETNDKETIMELFAHLFTPRKASLAEVVNAHLFSNISLEQMATLAGQSLSTFKREFKRHFQNSPAQYIREQRMKKAADLLRVTDLSISEISYQTGYDDSSHFSRVFHSFYEISPSAFRQSQGR